MKPLALRVAVLALAALASSAAPSIAGVDTLAEVLAPSPISAYGGVLAWSTFDPSTQTYTLMVRSGGVTRAAGVPTRTRPFDVDAGPGPGGEPLLAYSRCTTEDNRGRPPAAGCSLYLYDVGNGSERRLSIGRRRGLSQTHPAIWRDQIAWVWTSDDYLDTNPRLVLSKLDGSRRRIVNAITRYRCWRNYNPVPPRICGPTTSRRVNGIDLSPAGVAIVQSYSCPQANGVSGGCGGGNGQRDVVFARGGAHPRRIADSISGENGQAFVGPVFDGGALLFARACHGGDPGGPVECVARLIRYDLRTGRFKRTPSPVGLYGLASDAGSVYELFEPQNPGCSWFDFPADQKPFATGPCTLADAGPLSFSTFRDGRRP